MIICDDPQGSVLDPLVLNDFIQLRSSVRLFVWFKSGNSNLTHFQLSNCLETLQACVVWMTIQHF